MEDLRGLLRRGLAELGIDEGEGPGNFLRPGAGGLGREHVANFAEDGGVVGGGREAGFIGEFIEEGGVGGGVGILVWELDLLVAAAGFGGADALVEGLERGIGAGAPRVEAAGDGGGFEAEPGGGLGEGGGRDESGEGVEILRVGSAGEAEEAVSRLLGEGEVLVGESGVSGEEPGDGGGKVVEFCFEPLEVWVMGVGRGVVVGRVGGGGRGRRSGRRWAGRPGAWCGWRVGLEHAGAGAPERRLG